MLLCAHNNTVLYIVEIKIITNLFLIHQPSVAGSGLENAASYLGAAVLVGVLRPKSQNGLNLVSAPAVAKEMGLKVSVGLSARTATMIIVCGCVQPQWR